MASANYRAQEHVAHLERVLPSPFAQVVTDRRPQLHVAPRELAGHVAALGRHYESETSAGRPPAASGSSHPVSADGGSPTSASTSQDSCEVAVNQQASAWMAYHREQRLEHDVWRLLNNLGLVPQVMDHGFRATTSIGMRLLF
jgi:hypothetical protein